MSMFAVSAACTLLNTMGYRCNAAIPSRGSRKACQIAEKMHMVQYGQRVVSTLESAFANIGA